MEQLHKIDQEQRIEVQAARTPVAGAAILHNRTRFPRQSENSALQNLRAIAAGKGSSSRVRSKTSGRARQPARINIPEQKQTQSKPVDTTRRPQENKIKLTGDRDSVLPDLEVLIRSFGPGHC